MKVKARFHDEPGLKAKLRYNDVKIGVNFSNTVVAEKIIGDAYDGPYNVIPQLIGQELQTINKVMKNNVSIERIPTFEVSNDAGGETFVLVKEDFNGNK